MLPTELTRLLQSQIAECDGNLVESPDKVGIAVNCILLNQQTIMQVLADMNGIEWDPKKLAGQE